MRFVGTISSNLEILWNEYSYWYRDLFCLVFFWTCVLLYLDYVLDLLFNTCLKLGLKLTCTENVYPPWEDFKINWEGSSCINKGNIFLPYSFYMNI